MATKRGIHLYINEAEERLELYESDTASEYFGAYNITCHGGLFYYGICYELVNNLPVWIEDEKQLRTLIKTIGKRLMAE